MAGTKDFWKGGKACKECDSRVGDNGDDRSSGIE